jgi:hypothetical protein
MGVMTSSDITAMVVSFFLIGIPMIGFTARMVMKPLVEALVRLREAGVTSATRNEGLEQRQIIELQEEIQVLRRTVERLVEAENFNRQLGAGEKHDQTLR